MTTTYPGSLSLVRKHPGHVHGDNNDGTTTRHGKAIAMSGGINLRDPVRSIRRHRQARVRIVALACVVIVIVGATAVMLWRAWG